MYIVPNKERLSILDGITEEFIGQQVLFCPECDWQLPPGYVGKPKCAECGAHLHVSMIDQELVDLINGGYPAG